MAAAAAAVARETRGCPPTKRTEYSRAARGKKVSVWMRERGKTRTWHHEGALAMTRGTVHASVPCNPVDTAALCLAELGTLHAWRDRLVQEVAPAVNP